MLKMKSMHMRNFLFSAAMILLSLLILGLAFMTVIRSYVINEKRSNLLAIAQTVSDVAAAKSLEVDLWDMELRMTITSISLSAEADIIISDTEGTVVSCSDEDFFSPHLGFVISSDILDTIETSGSYTATGTLSGYYEDNCYIAAVPITVSYGSDYLGLDVTVGYIFATSSLESTNQIWVTFAEIFLVATAVVLLVTLVLSLMLSGREAAPLKEMASASKRFAHGDFSVRVTDTGRIDEIGELTRDFNSMADSLERSEQLRRDFVANVSHELKTPMTTISGFADGILDGTIPAEKSAEYLEIISSETKRLSRLVRDMLDSSRLQSLDISEIRQHSFDICELMRRTLLSLENKINAKELSVNVSIPETEIWVQGLEDSITQVVYNLLDNAVKFAFRGSELGFSLTIDGKKAIVSVKDNGETIPAEEIPLIFDRFHKADSSRSLDRDGAGLGLYLVKTILGSHGEDIYVSSQNNITEFRFTLTIVPKHEK